MRKNRLTIILSGMIAAVPHHGGATWAVLQYLLGLRQLGHDVYLIEPLDANALRPASHSLERSHNAAYFHAVMEEFGLENCAALLLTGTKQTVGLPYAHLAEIARRADLLLNISGMLADSALLEKIPARVYLDLDPAFIQLWHAVEGIDMRFARHTHFATVGQAIGQPGCSIPTCGLRWIPTLQPVVLSHWRVAEQITYDALTTVANWRGYGSIEHNGTFYGQKAHSLRQFIALPMLTDERFMPALGIHPNETDDLAALRQNGWQLLDPLQVASTPSRYQHFIQKSKAEFGIAKSGYVASKCGWFSDRSACYLASGRPVIAQETGFSQFLPTGEGLFAFTTYEDVLSSVEAIRYHYQQHSCAARAIAEEFLDSDRVLFQLLNQVGLA
jgi:hypothetical protein